MPQYVVQTTARALEREGIAVKGSSVLVLGVAYKRDIDDLRESPALTIIEMLQAAGATVQYNDPFFPRWGEAASMICRCGRRRSRSWAVSTAW